ncbi:MAG: amidohydrolase [Rhodospirillales bacterium]|nr:amidohydrolase [Rhodospirillales bacterium]
MPRPGIACITDAQVHLWEADRPDRPWAPGGHANAHPLPAFSAAELLAEMDAAGIDRVVIVPPSWEGERNDLALAAAAAHPARFAVMGRFPIDPARAGELAGWRARPGMLGLRFVHRAGQDFLDPGIADGIWAAAERHGLPVMLSAPSQLANIARIARAHPGLRIVIDHMAIPREAQDAPAFAHIPALCALAALPNIAVKASALPRFTAAPFPFTPVHAPLRRVVAAFGPRRVFWGTDLTGLPCSYAEALDFIDAALPDLGTEDRAWLLGRGIAAWLGWPDPSGGLAPRAGTSSRP